jgi:cell fate regulator YaaT (PSP1 superfamily)
MMDYSDNESIKFDCSRGCTVTQDPLSGEYECNYRQGCCKLESYDWLHGVIQEQYKDLFEVRFKNTRKGIYFNASGQGIKTGDLVIVEAANGHDLGIVTLEGPIVGRQMKCKGVDPDPAQLKKIYRKAKPLDIAKWQEAIAREQDTMIQARRIAAELGLDMKIGDVEFQGDGTKAIFYYIADGRVDFRQLIKVYAEEFRIRIEMKQIGARQEAGLIGGLGVCGRELCCANYITNFQSISTSAARTQDLSLNPQKLAGQCGKLKCCLNYEVANYIDAQSRIPKVTEPLEFEDGQAWLVKTDILQEVLYFSYEKGSLSNLYPLSADEVREVMDMNARGERPESLKSEPVPDGPQFISAVGDDSITRFDKPKKNKKKKSGKNRRNGGKARKDE